MAVAVFTEGDFVLHPQLGIGSVALAGSDEVLVSYDGGQEEVYTIGRSGSLPITKLSPDGFYLWKRDRAADLREAFASRPLDVVTALKVDIGNVLSPAALKRELSPLLPEGAAWDQTFTDLVTAAAADPRFSADKKQGITYRGELNEIASELLARFRSASSLKEKIRACKEIIKMQDRGIDMEENREAAIGFFYGTASNRSNQFGARIESLLFLKILAPECYEPLSGPIIEELAVLNVTAAAEAIAIVTDSTVRKELLEIFKDCQPSRFIEISATLTKRFRKAQRDWVLDVLLADKNPQFITTIITATLDDIPTNTQPFIWIARTLIHHPDHIADLGFDRDDIIRAFFKTLANIHITTAYSSRGDEDAALSREETEMLALLNDRKPLLKFLKGQNEPEFTHMFAALYVDCSAMSDESKNDFLEVLKKEFPTIDFKANTIATQESITLSRDAYDRFSAELADLLENKIPQNIKAIQAARELGDLSENAEYHAAREKQSFLIGRKHQIERMLEYTTIID